MHEGRHARVHEAQLVRHAGAAGACGWRAEERVAEGGGAEGVVWGEGEGGLGSGDVVDGDGGWVWSWGSSWGWGCAEDVDVGHFLVFDGDGVGGGGGGRVGVEALGGRVGRCGRRATRLDADDHLTCLIVAAGVGSGGGARRHVCRVGGGVV